MKPQLEFGLQEYSVVRNDRKTVSGGGEAIFIRNQLQYRVIKEIGEYEAVGVDVYVENQMLEWYIFTTLAID